MSLRLQALGRLGDGAVWEALVEVVVSERSPILRVDPVRRLRGVASPTSAGSSDQYLIEFTTRAKSSRSLRLELSLDEADRWGRFAH